MTLPAGTLPDQARTPTRPNWATCPLAELWEAIEAANADTLPARAVRVRVTGRVRAALSQ